MILQVNQAKNAIVNIRFVASFNLDSFLNSTSTGDERKSVGKTLEFIVVNAMTLEVQIHSIFSLSMVALLLSVF